ncbi:hypothetical protein ACJ41O_013200 [Fusarium nematophilum]
MPIPSRWTAHVPKVSLPTWIFGSPSASLPHFTTYVDAARPDTHKLSFEDYRLWSKKIGLGLKNAGIRPGDRVLFFGGNHLLFPCIFMGVIMSGGVFTGANPAFTSKELAYQLSDSKPTFLIAASEVLHVATEAAEQAGLSKSRIFGFDGSTTNECSSEHPEDQHWSQLVAADDEARSFEWVEPLDPASTTCCLNYSSGTSGLPKGVETTHSNYVATGESALARHNLDKKAQAGEHPEVALCFLPLYHVAAQTVYAIDYPKMGATTYMMSGFKFPQMLECIQRFGVTELLAAPPIIQALSSPLARKYNLSSVKNIFSGTAPLSSGVARKAEQLWPDGQVRIQQAWGMTELTGAGAVWDSSEVPMLASVGEVIPNGSFKLMDGDKEIDRPDVPGELWFTGPSLMKGYWGNPEATRDTIVEEDSTRWMKTGDVAYVDSCSPGVKIFLVDRVKELIKVRGLQVAPAELEAVLLESPDVADVGVVAVQIRDDQAPRAYVVKAAGSNVTEQDIARWVEERLIEYKWLSGGVEFVDKIPRNGSGKILRRVLREKAKEESSVLGM